MTTATKRFIVRVSRNMRDSMAYALSEPWYMFVVGLLVGMALIAAHDSHTIKHLQALTTTLSNNARVEEHPRTAAPVAVEQPTKTEVCVDRLLDATVDPMLKPTRTYYPLGGDATIERLRQQHQRDQVRELPYPDSPGSKAPPKGTEKKPTQWQDLILGMFADSKRDA